MECGSLEGGAEGPLHEAWGLYVIEGGSGTSLGHLLCHMPGTMSGPVTSI